DVADPTLVTLRYRLGSFVVAGLGAALGPLVVRKFKGAVDHLGGGLAAGLAGAAAWHAMNHVFGTDLYGAGAALGLAFGGTFGLLAWGLPDEL
ncbi:MAG: hypothetical protein QGG40_09550, partial [Myxococcota bacterium]|nr:hypothetical protein [Myxococcota bacterium]